MRRALLAAVLAGCLVVAALPAFAADQGVLVGDSFFSPADVTVQPGEKVTWTNPGTAMSHNVHFQGEAQLNPASTSFTVEKSFPAAGVYAYRCDVHPVMTGTVRVGAAPTATPTAGATSTATATATATPPGTGDPAPSGGGTPAVGGTGLVQTRAAGITGFSARATRSAFCARRSARCRVPGVFLEVWLAADAPVVARGTLRRAPLRGGRFRAAGTVRPTLIPGRRRVRLKPSRRLAAGRYTLRLSAGTFTRSVRFRVR